MHGNRHDLIIDIKTSQAAEIEAFRKIAWLTHPMLIPIQRLITHMVTAATDTITVIQRRSYRSQVQCFAAGEGTEDIDVTAAMADWAFWSLWTSLIGADANLPVK